MNVSQPFCVIKNDAEMWKCVKPHAWPVSGEHCAELREPAAHFVMCLYSFKWHCIVLCSSWCCSFHFNTLVCVFSSQASLLLLIYMCFALQFMFLKRGDFFLFLTDPFRNCNAVLMEESSWFLEMHIFYEVEPSSTWISSLDMCLKNKYLELFNNVSFLKIKEESGGVFFVMNSVWKILLNGYSGKIGVTNVYGDTSGQMKNQKLLSKVNWVFNAVFLSGTENIIRFLKKYFSGITWAIWKHMFFIDKNELAKCFIIKYVYAFKKILDNNSKIFMWYYKYSYICCTLHDY